MQNLVRKMRESRGLSLERVAEKLGTTKAQLSKVERGLNRLSDFWLEKFAKLYHCSVHDLIDDDPVKGVIKNDELLKRNYITAGMLGCVDTKQTGLVVYSDAKDHYPVSVSMPSLMSRFSHYPDFLALTLKNGGFMNLPNEAQCVFASLTEREQLLIKKGSIVLCSQKDNKGQLREDFIRVIEYDLYGIPYASYPMRYSRGAVAPMASIPLLGKISVPELLALNSKIDNSPVIPKKPQPLRKIPLENHGLDIKALLVKVVVDA